jgi:RNA polymerase sigma-70 factor, ECF subfamily
LEVFFAHQRGSCQTRRTARAKWQDSGTSLNNEFRMDHRNRERIPSVPGTARENEADFKKADPMTEEALMSAYRTGDRTAFESLFALLGPRVHGFFMRSFQNRAIADDLLQITFLKLHRARADYDASQPLRPWVFSIAARVRLDEYRRRKHVMEDLDKDLDQSSGGRMERLSSGTPDGPPPSAPDALESAERAKSVRVALDTLPESQRVIVHLHRFEGLTFAQIATALGSTEGAVKLRAFRAYEKLRTSLRHLMVSDGPS